MATFVRRQACPLVALLCYVRAANSQVAESSARPVEIPIKRVYLRSNSTSAASAEMVLAEGSTYDRVTNFFDLQYTANVDIGTPPRSLTVCLDTGSADLWFDGLVDTYSSTRKCPAKGCDQRTEIQYGKGDVQGAIRVDQVRFGDSAPFEQEFVLADNITELTARNFDGVLGLAFDQLSHTGTTIMQKLSGVTDVFCFYLTDEEEQSWFVLGMPRAEWQDGDFTYSRVVVKAWWTFEAAWGVGDKLLIEKTCFALDTGTSYLTVPKVDYPTMIDYVLPKSLREDPEYDCEFSANNLWTCLCSVRKLMDISCVMLNGKAFPIFPEDIMRPNILGSECTLQIQQSGNNLPWILGDTFLRTIVPIFDMKNSRIGMALRKTHKPSLRESEEKLARSNDIVWGKPVLKPFYPGDNFDWKMLWWAVPLVLCGGVAVGLLLGTIIAKAMDLCCPPKRRIVTPAQTAQRQTAPAAAPQGRAAAAAEGRESQAPYVQLA
mmetsp:Transcript_115599/g.222796  ORF Transcript_115599/g.222796 Transcript_115599/m.222796 type:complete len:490 (-) Transcript_115599:141-1610(-)